jgi:hypothetical protein
MTAVSAMQNSEPPPTDRVFWGSGGASAERGGMLLLALQLEIQLFWFPVILWQEVVENFQLLPAHRSTRLVETDAIAHQDAHRFAVEGVLALQLSHSHAIISHACQVRGA